MLHKNTLESLRQKVSDAEESEKKLNRRLGYSENEHRGSTVVSIRWMDLKELLDMYESTTAMQECKKESR